jgi:hypothetical protein
MAKMKTEELLNEYQERRRKLKVTHKQYQKAREEYFTEKRAVTRLRKKYGRVLQLFS